MVNYRQKRCDALSHPWRCSNMAQRNPVTVRSVEDNDTWTANLCPGHERVARRIGVYTARPGPDLPVDWERAPEAVFVKEVVRE